MTFLSILFITACCILAGSVAFCVVMNGPASVIGAPIVALFGLFYLLPVYIAITVAWLLYDCLRGSTYARAVLYLCLCLAGGCLMFIFGPGDQGALRWTLANVLGGCTGGLVGAYMITKLKGRYDERMHTNRRHASVVGGTSQEAST